MKTVCDRCDNYNVSPAGCSDSCNECKSNPYYLTRGYFEDRRDGIKKSCKGFKVLRRSTEEQKLYDIAKAVCNI